MTDKVRKRKNERQRESEEEKERVTERKKERVRTNLNDGFSEWFSEFFEHVLFSHFSVSHVHVVYDSMSQVVQVTCNKTKILGLNLP